MSRTYDCREPAERQEGIAAAVDALRRGDLVVMPTDTVYGVAADAFTPPAVDALLRAKMRGRDMPVGVLVGSWRSLDGLMTAVPASVREIIEAFWPGGLSLVVQQAPSLSWDLGDSRGTVMVRMPLHPVALEVLHETGPLAVSSANVSGLPPATSAADARTQLADAVDVYLESGSCGEPVASTILDVTGPVPRLLRNGAIPTEALREVIGDLEQVR
ncbi:MAG: L-threonylcarbamoyladenylate synthase [Actinomycetota bacterium]|nr:L-threonylcarbamoyladenylate synthase [Actinomycetota bacterium]